MICKNKSYECDCVALLAIEYEKRGYLPNESFLKAKTLWDKLMLEDMDELMIHTEADHMDYLDPAVFPLFVKDSLESLTNRYFKMFPTEAKFALMEIESLFDDKGFSKTREMRVVTNLPAFLKNVLRKLDKDFFVQENRADNYRKLSKIMRKFFPGRV